MKIKYSSEKTKIARRAFIIGNSLFMAIIASIMLIPLLKVLSDSFDGLVNYGLNFIPQPYDGMTKPQIYKTLQCSARPYEAYARCFKRIEDSRIHQYAVKVNAFETEYITETPVGKISAIGKRTPSSPREIKKKWLLTSEEDMKVACWIEERCQWVFDEEAYLEEYAVWGELGAPTMPTGSVMFRATYIKRFLSIILLVAIVMSGLIASQLARRNMRPINSIVKLLNEVDPPGELGDNNAIDYVRGSIRFLIQNNNELKNAMDKQIPLLRAAFLKSLFYGGFKNANEMLAVASSADIQLCGDAYLVLIIKLYGNEIGTDVDTNIISEWNIKRLLVKDTVEKYIYSKCMLEIDNDSIAVLMKFDMKDIGKCKSFTEEVTQEIYRELNRLYSLTVLFAAGNIYEDLLETDQSFEKAKTILYTKHEHPPCILLWYEDLPKQSGIYHYPIDLENKIINFTRVGEFNKVEALINRVYEENFVTNRILSDVGKELVAEVKGTIVKILPLCDIDADKELMLSRVDINEPIENIFENFKGILKEICDSTNEKRNDSQKELASKILDYIEKNYAHPDMCLYMVASQFDISEGYLCHFFKNYIKVNFTNHIESLRMRKSYEMLQDKNFTIGDIAKAVGYNNVQSFRRAFKRQTGINPSSFRG